MSRESDRDFSKYPLAKVPIPAFNSNSFRHRRLVELSKGLHAGVKFELGVVEREEVISKEKATAEVSLLAGDALIREHPMFEPFVDKPEGVESHYV